MLKKICLEINELDHLNYLTKFASQGQFSNGLQY